MGVGRRRLTTAPVLVCPDWSKPFTLQTDTSQEGLGAVPSQSGEQGEWIIAYASRSIFKTEQNYSTTELKCLAVKWGIWKMYHFTILTDHSPGHSKNAGAPVPSVLLATNVEESGKICLRLP